MTESRIEARLAALGINLPSPPAAAGAYVPCLTHGGLLYVSGQLPIENGAVVHKGKLGQDLTLAQGQDAAALAARNALAQARRELGSLDRISRCVRMVGYIACVPSFSDHAQVLNGASNLIHSVFEEGGQHVRAAVGAASLPLDAAVEIEFLFAVS